MDRTRTGSRANRALEGDHLPVPRLHLTAHAEQAGDREAPDVGIEDPDLEATGGQGDGQVDRDRRLAHAALPRGDGEHPRARRRTAVVGRVLPRLPAGACHDGSPLLGVHGGDPHLDRSDPLEARHVARHVAFDLVPHRAAGHGQGDVDHDATSRRPPRRAPSPGRRSCRPSSGSITPRSRWRTSSARSPPAVTGAERGEAMGKFYLRARYFPRSDSMDPFAQPEALRTAHLEGPRAEGRARRMQ